MTPNLEAGRAFQASLGGAAVPRCLAWRLDKDYLEADETAGLNIARAFISVYLLYGHDPKKIPDEVLKIWDAVPREILAGETKKLKKKPASVCKLVEFTSAKSECDDPLCEWRKFEQEVRSGQAGPKNALKEANQRIPAWIKAHHFKTVEDTEKLYHYDHGVYLESGEVILKALVESEFSDITTDTLIRDVIGKVKRRTYTKRALFNNGHVLNVKNGLIDLDTMELQPHSPDYLSTAQLNIIYDPTATAPRTKTFLEEVAQAKDIPLIEEIIGWLLWPEYTVHKALMLLGQGRNGKGTLLRLITALIGKDNVSNVSLQELASDRFSKADLFGKLANIGGDLPAKDLSDTATFRGLTGGDRSRAQGKYAMPFNFDNTAKMLFSANLLPRSPDDTNAFYSRWIILEFLHTFDPQKGTGDSDLDSKLQTPEELSGLLNIALAGLARLKANGWRFSYDKTVEDVELMYKRNANPVLAFLIDECEERPESYIEKNVLLSRFKEYAERHGLRPVSTTKFSELLKDQTEIPVSDYRPWTGGGAAPRCWLGIKLKNEYIKSRAKTDKGGSQSIPSMVFPTPAIVFENKLESEECSRKRVAKTVDGMDCNNVTDPSTLPIPPALPPSGSAGKCDEVKPLPPIPEYLQKVDFNSRNGRRYCRRCFRVSNFDLYHRIDGGFLCGSCYLGILPDGEVA